MTVKPTAYTTQWFNGVLSAYHWAGNLLTYSIPQGSANFDRDYSDLMEWNGWYALTSAHRAAFHDIINEVNSFTNLNLVAVEDSDSYGDIRIAFTDYTYTGSSGHAYYPSPYYVNGTLASAASGDIWLDDDLWYDSAATGTWLNHTMRHELGHALGLGHPFEAEQGFPLSPAAYDSYRYTVMSYSDHPDIPYTVAAGFQPMDIAALQYLYGANTQYNSGNNRYRFNDDVGLRTLWDGGGYDTFDFSALSDAVRIDLSPGGFSSAGTVTNLSGYAVEGINNLAIAEGVQIERLIATPHDDRVYGAHHDNDIELGAGNDRYYWRGGYDVVLGGSGQDTLILPGTVNEWALYTANGLQLDQLTLRHPGSLQNRVSFSEMELITFDNGSMTPHQLMFGIQGDARLGQQHDLWDSDIITGSGDISSVDAQLYRTYLGIMGRTPDKAGFDWWANELEQGRSLRDMTAGFYYSPEFIQRADMNQDSHISPQELLTELYTNTLGRRPDSDGYNWWLNKLYSGDKSAPEVMLEFTQSDEYVTASLQIVGLQLWLS